MSNSGLPYGHTESIARLNALVGGDLARDLIKVSIEDENQALDVSAATVPTDSANVDADSADSETVQSDDSSTIRLEAPGSTMLEGRIDRLRSYSVDVEWLDEEYDTLFSETLLNAGTGSRTFTAEADGPIADVKIIDEASKDSDAAYSIIMGDGTDVSVNEPIDVSAKTVPTEQQTPIELKGTDNSGTTETIQAEDLGTALNGSETAVITALARALSDVGNAQIRVETPNPIDVSAATVTTDVGDRAGRNIGKARLMDSTGTLLDPVDQSDASQITDQDSGTGSANAAQLDLGDLRQSFDIHVDTSGDATLTVEVSTSGKFSGEERTFASISYTGASQEIEQFETKYQHIRAFLDQNRTLVEIAARGMR